MSTNRRNRRPRRRGRQSVAPAAAPAFVKAAAAAAAADATAGATADAPAADADAVEKKVIEEQGQMQDLSAPRRARARNKRAKATLSSNSSTPFSIAGVVRSVGASAGLELGRGLDSERRRRKRQKARRAMGVRTREKAAKIEAAAAKQRQRFEQKNLKWRLQKMNHVFDSNDSPNSVRSRGRSGGKRGSNVGKTTGAGGGSGSSGSGTKVMDGGIPNNHINHLEPDHGPMEGGAYVAVHADQFDKVAYQNGHIWVRWGMYKLAVEWKSNTELICRQPSMPEMHKQDLFKETEMSMLQYRLHEEFSLRCWCGKQGIQKKMALKNAERISNPISFSEWFASHPRKRERILKKYGNPEPETLASETFSHKMRQYYEVAITVDNGLSFGPSKRFYLDSAENHLGKALLDDDITRKDAQTYHARKLRAHKIYTEQIDGVLRLRKDEAKKKEEEEKLRDAMPDAMRAEADLKAALDHKEAEKRDHERLEAQNEATDKRNREIEAVMSARIGIRRGRSSVIARTGELDALDAKRATLTRIDDSDIGIVRWGGEKPRKSKLCMADGSTPGKTNRSRSINNFHPSAFISLAGAPLIHPRQERFHVCLQITRTIATSTAGLIDWPQSNLDIEKYKALFAVRDGWLSGKRATGRKASSKSVSFEEYDPSSKLYAENGLRQARIFGHNGGPDALRRHIKKIVQQGNYGQAESTEDILPNINRVFVDHRLLTLVTAISEAIIASEVARATNLEKSRKKTFGKKWKKLTAAELSVLTDKEFSKMMFPLQPASVHAEAVRHCIYSDSIQNLICHMIRFSDRLFLFSDRRVRDIKLVRPAGNKKSTDSTVQMILHESGIVSIRSYKRDKPSQHAQEYVGVEGGVGDLKRQPVPAIQDRGNFATPGSRVFARESSSHPWMPGKIVRTCDDDGTFDILFDHLYDPDAPAFVDASLNIQRANMRPVKDRDGVGGRSGTFTERELSNLHTSDVRIPDIDNQHIISSEVVEEYHETEATIMAMVGGRSSRTKESIEEAVLSSRPSLPPEVEWPRSNYHLVEENWTESIEVGMHEYIKSLATLVWKDVNHRLLGRSRLKSGAFTFMSPQEKERQFRTRSKCLNVLETSLTVEEADGTLQDVKQYKIEASFREMFWLSDKTYQSREEAGKARDMALLDRHRYVPEGKAHTDYSMLHFPRETYDNDMGAFEPQEMRSRRIEKESTRGWFFSEQLAYVAPIEQIDYIACGENHFCAVSGKHCGARLFTWGSNSTGELGRSTGKETFDPNPGVVVFKSSVKSQDTGLHDWQPTPKGELDVVTAISYLVDRDTASKRVVRVTSICCGSNFTVCATIGEHDGQASVYSWGWAPERKPTNSVRDYIARVSSSSSLKIRGGVPHDFSHWFPQEVLRMRPMVYKGFTLSDHLGNFSGGGLNSQRAQSFSREKKFVRRALDFFPVKLDGFVRSEWNRWKFNHKNAVGKLKKSLREDVSRYTARRKPMGVRRIAVLVTKKRQNILDMSNVVQEFGESCDRAANMKSDLLKDIISSTPEVADLISLDDAGKESHFSEIDAEPFIAAFIDAGMKLGKPSVLGHLCADFERHAFGREKEPNAGKSTPANKAGYASLNSETLWKGSDPSKRHANLTQPFSWKMRKRAGKRAWTIENDVAWFEILNRKAKADEFLTEARLQFADKWSNYKLVSLELQQRNHELDILRSMRDSFAPGDRCGLSNVELAQKILLGKEYQNVDISTLKVPEKFSKLKQRRSTGILEIKVHDLESPHVVSQFDQTISEGLVPQTPPTSVSGSSKRRSRRFSNPDALPSRSSKAAVPSSQAGTSVLENMNNFSVSEPEQYWTKNFQERRYHEARGLESERVRMRMRVKLSDANTDAWAPEVAIGSTGGWNKERIIKRQTAIIKNIQDMDMKLTLNDLEDVIDLMFGETLSYKEELEELRRNAYLLQSKIDELVSDANLFGQCTEDWIFSSIVDKIDGKKDLPKPTAETYTDFANSSTSKSWLDEVGFDEILPVRYHHASYNNEMYYSQFQLEVESLLSHWHVSLNESSADHTARAFKAHQRRTDRLNLASNSVAAMSFSADGEMSAQDSEDGPTSARGVDSVGMERSIAEDKLNLGVRGFVPDATYSLKDYKMIGSFAMKHHGLFLHYKTKIDKTTRDDKHATMLITLLYSNIHHMSLNIEYDLKTIVRLPQLLDMSSLSKNQKGDNASARSEDGGTEFVDIEDEGSARSGTGTRDAGDSEPSVQTTFWKDVCEGRVQKVQFALRQGADIHATDPAGKNALEMAEDRGVRSALIKHLIDHRGNPDVYSGTVDTTPHFAKKGITTLGETSDVAQSGVRSGGVRGLASGQHQNHISKTPQDKKVKRGRGVNMFHFDAAMLKLSLTPTMAYQVAEYIYMRTKEILSQNLTSISARGKEIGLLHYSLFGKILHDSPWKMSIEEIGACISYMIQGSHVEQNSVVDYLEFARTIKRKHFDRQDLAELKSSDRYYSRIHVYPSQLAEDEVCASFETFRLEEEQRREEEHDRETISRFAGQSDVSLSYYCSNSSDSDWSDEDDTHESVIRYRYHNNMNKRDPQKSVNMQMMDVVVKQSIIIESAKMIEACEEPDTLNLVEKLAQKQGEIIASVKETFTMPDGNAPMIVTITIDEGSTFPIMTYRMALEEGSELSEYIIEKMHRLHHQPDEELNMFNRYATLLKRLLHASTVAIRVTHAHKRIKARATDAQ